MHLLAKLTLTSLGSRNCSSLIHNGSRHPCTLVAPPQKGFTLLSKIPFTGGHLLFLPLRLHFPCALKGAIFQNKKRLVLLERKTLHPVHAIFWFEDARLQTASETIFFFNVCDGVSECLQQAVFRISVPRSIHLSPSGTRKKSQKK